MLEVRHSNQIYFYLFFSCLFIYIAPRSNFDNMNYALVFKKLKENTVFSDSYTICIIAFGSQKTRNVQIVPFIFSKHRKWIMYSEPISCRHFIQVLFCLFENHNSIHSRLSMNKFLLGELKRIFEKRCFWVVYNWIFLTPCWWILKYFLLFSSCRRCGSKSLSHAHDYNNIIFFSSRRSQGNYAPCILLPLKLFVLSASFIELSFIHYRHYSFLPVIL